MKDAAACPGRRRARRARQWPLPHGMAPIADLLELHGPGRDRVWVVASNGAVVFATPARGGPRETFDARPAVEAILERHPEALVAVEERGVGYRVNSHFPDGELSGDMIPDRGGGPARRGGESCDHPRPQLHRRRVRGARRGPRAARHQLRGRLDRLARPGPVGVSKASGLQHVAEQLGLTGDDALAVGDGRNDLEMFAWARRSVAMGQAIEQVIAAADDVTASVYDDGLATELDRWFRDGRSTPSSTPGFGPSA